jgi:hypothetical protein
LKEDAMSIDPRRHTQDRNWLEDLLRKIPGFRGYLEKEYRRESDELQRQWLADRLQRAKQASDRTARSLADAGKLDVLPQLDRLRARLDKLIARIRGAMQGYSGVFDLVRINEAVLEQVYSYDATLVDQLEALSKLVEQLPAEPDKLTSSLPEVHQKVDAIEAAWDQRENLLRGLT